MSDSQNERDQPQRRPGPWEASQAHATQVPPAVSLTAAMGAGRSPEPMFNAPLPAVLLVATLIASYPVQLALGGDAVVERWAFSPVALWQGRWSGLITALFLHGGWTHVLMNSVGALAFGAPVARLFGSRLGGAVGFWAFYLVCGMLSCLGYALVHPGSPNLLVGASGAVSGLMGAASRLIERRPSGGRGPLAPFTSPTVVGMAGAWAVVNGLIALIGFGPGTGGQPVAWEAHLFGYAAGLLLVSPTAHLLNRARIRSER